MKRDRGDDGGTEGRHSRVDAETLRYYEEIGSHFSSLEDQEEKEILAENVLTETLGRQTQILPDAACSRVIEAVIPYASIATLSKLMKGCLEEDNLGVICTSGPFGSHVVENLLQALVGAAAGADDAGYETIEGAIDAFTDTAVANLYDMITSKYGSFVGRRLLSILCGQDVTSPPQRKTGQTDDTQKRQRNNATTNNLKSRVIQSNINDKSSSHRNASAVTFPHCFHKITAVILSDEWTGPDLTSIQSDPYAGPFLQSLLRACVALEDDALAGRLVIHLLGGNAASGADTLSSDALYHLMTDRNGSHLMEAAFEAAPDDVLQKMCTLAFKGRLLALAQHPSANFAVQAALASVRRPQQLKRMFEDLRPHLATLLRARRGGVVTVLIAAAGRVGSLEADCADALWHSLRSGMEGYGSPVHKLLTLDTTIRDLATSSGAVRLSPLGCAALITLLQYPPTAIKEWSDTILNMSPGELSGMARDPGGCRVIEAFIEGPGGAPKKRRRILQSISGTWAAASTTMAGCRFIEKCYSYAEPVEKESITAELTAHEDRIGATTYGAALLHTCHVEAYKKGGKDWQKRIETAQEVRKEFEELFGDGNEEEHGEKGKLKGETDTNQLPIEESPIEEPVGKKVKKEKKGRKEKTKKSKVKKSKAKMKERK